jgi:hypothetical protein
LYWAVKHPVCAVARDQPQLVGQARIVELSADVHAN